MCLNKFNVVFPAYVCLHWASSSYFSSILIINYWVLFFFFVSLSLSLSFPISVSMPIKVERGKIISFAHCKYFDSQRIFFIKMFCFGSYTTQEAKSIKDLLPDMFSIYKCIKLCQYCQRVHFFFVKKKLIALLLCNFCWNEIVYAHKIVAISENLIFPFHRMFK